MNEMNKYIGNEKGSTIILITILITVLTGMAAMVTDAGAIYMTRAKLQNAVDAAALAALQDLPVNPTQAAETALTYAQTDCPPDSVIDTPQILESDRAALVSAHKTVNYGLARILGVESKIVNVQALARLEPITGVRGTLPLAVMEEVWAPGQTVVLKGGAQEMIFSGWRGTFAGGQWGQ